MQLEVLNLVHIFELLYYMTNLSILEFSLSCGLHSGKIIYVNYRLGDCNATPLATMVFFILSIILLYIQGVIDDITAHLQLTNTIITCSLRYTIQTSNPRSCPLRGGKLLLQPIHGK